MRLSATSEEPLYQFRIKFENRNRVSASNRYNLYFIINLQFKKLKQKNQKSSDFELFILQIYIISKCFKNYPFFDYKLLYLLFIKCLDTTFVIFEGFN